MIKLKNVREPIHGQVMMAVAGDVYKDVNEQVSLQIRDNVRTPLIYKISNTVWRWLLMKNLNESIEGEEGKLKS